MTTKQQIKEIQKEIIKGVKFNNENFNLLYEWANEIRVIYSRNNNIVITLIFLSILLGLFNLFYMLS